jgi:LmbE family N-acetylglucosaminyl deacetylase
MRTITRRHMLSALLATGVSVFPSFPHNQEATPYCKLKVLVTGAHPDDPETGCGGTIAKLSEAGHEVIALCLTRGERGINGKSHSEAAHIRTNEALKACEILKARAVFATQIDGDCEINQERYEEIKTLVEKEQPHIIFTHWPVDSHPDHRVCSSLVYDVWSRSGKKSAFYYYEVMTGHQSQNFSPTDYVDITSVIEKKHHACFVHESQNIKQNYPKDHGKMEIFRGMESGFQFAEAFIHRVKSPKFAFFSLQVVKI